MYDAHTPGVPVGEHVGDKPAGSVGALVVGVDVGFGGYSAEVSHESPDHP